MSDTDLKVLVKAKELAVHTFKLTSNANRFPKKYRHSLGDRMQLTSLDIYTTLFEANRINNATNKRERIEKITKGITYCDELLFLIELTMNLGLLANKSSDSNDSPKPSKSAEYWSKMVSDVKYMAIAWRTKEKQ